MLSVAIIYILACFAPCFAIGFLSTWLFASPIVRVVLTVMGVSIVFILGDVKSFLHAVQYDLYLQYFLYNSIAFLIACLMPGIAGILMQLAFKKWASDGKPPDTK